MSETDLDLGSTNKWRSLWIVLWLNVGIVVGFEQALPLNSGPSGAGVLARAFSAFGQHFHDPA